MRILEIPKTIGPVQFGRLGSWITVRCPREYDAFMQNAGGQFLSASRRWLIEPQKIEPLIRELRRGTVQPPPARGHTSRLTSATALICFALLSLSGCSPYTFDATGRPVPYSTLQDGGTVRGSYNCGTPETPRPCREPVRRVRTS